MEENKKTTSPSNVVYASLGSSQYPRARLFSHMFEYFVIFFSSAFHGKAKENREPETVDTVFTPSTLISNLVSWTP